MEWVSLDPMDTPSGRRRKIVGLMLFMLFLLLFHISETVIKNVKCEIRYLVSLSQLVIVLIIIVLLAIVVVVVVGVVVKVVVDVLVVTLLSSSS